MKKMCLPVLVFMGAALGSASFFGCGDSERTESGTQVQVTEEANREAEASANYFESQSKPKKSQSKKN